MTSSSQHEHKPLTTNEHEHEHEHESLGHKLKNAVFGSHSHSEMKTPSEIASQKHRATSEHERLEAEADARMLARENEQASEPIGSFEPPEVTNGRLGLEEIVHHQQSGAVHEGHPDMLGGTHIQERNLPQRHHEKQHTATRPSDPNDPTAMDGAVRNDTSAGDEYAI